MRRLIFAALALAGCAGTEARALIFPHPEHEMVATASLNPHDDGYCRSLLSRQRTYGAFGAGAAFAGGSGGILAAFPAQGDARLGVGAASLGAGAAGAVLMYLAASEASEFSRYCTTAPAGR